MLASRSMEKVITRVTSAWKASAIRSNISFKYSVLTLYVQGDPTCDACILARDYLRLRAENERYENMVAKIIL